MNSYNLEDATATLLGDGTVLSAGGMDYFGESVARAKSITPIREASRKFRRR